VIVLKKKVLVLHPPMYPVNYKFYDLLGKHVNLTVIQLGEHPVHHTSWNINNYDRTNISFKIHVIGKGAVSLKDQLNLSYLKILYKTKPDIVLSIAFWFPSFILSISRLLFNFKFIILTNVIDETEIDSPPFIKIFRKIISMNTDVFISASKKTSSHINRNYRNSKIALSTQTIDVSSWIDEYYEMDPKSKLRESLMIPKDKIIMLGVGNFTEKKNWDIVFRSIDKSDQIHFLLIGSGALESQYSNMVSKLMLKVDVTILPKQNQSEIKKYYKASDFLVFPSNFDQFGYVVPEALSFKLPVLCSKNTGASILIRNGYNGYLIDPNHNIKKYMSKLVLDLTKMQTNSQESIRNLTLENRVLEFYEIFKRELDD